MVIFLLCLKKHQTDPTYIHETQSHEANSAILCNPSPFPWGCRKNCAFPNTQNCVEILGDANRCKQNTKPKSQTLFKKYILINMCNARKQVEKKQGKNRSSKPKPSYARDFSLSHPLFLSF